MVGQVGGQSFAGQPRESAWARLLARAAGSLASRAGQPSAREAGAEPPGDPSIDDAPWDGSRRVSPLIAQSPNPIVLLNLDCRLVYANRACCDLCGYAFDELVERGLASVVVPEDLERVTRALRRAAEGEPQIFDVAAVANGGRRLELSATVIPIVVDGAVVALYGTIKDMTERNQALAALREAEARYRTLIEHLPVVIYTEEVGGPDRVTYVSPQVQSMLGYAPEDWLANPGQWMEIVHPDDWARVNAANEHANRTGEPFRVEYRVVRPDGRVVWVRDEAVLVRDAEGRPTHWQGVMLDITHQKEAEAQLQEAEARYRTLVEQIPAAVYIDVIGEPSYTAYISPRIEAIVGYSPEEFLSGPGFWPARVHPDDRERLLSTYQHADATGEPYAMEYRVYARDGRLVWVRDEAELIRDEEGHPRLWQGIIVDITQQKTLEARLLHQAFHDPLTGLPNRALFMDRLNHALARTERGNGIVAVIFLDLDDFKVINDSLGHKAGDQLLVEVGRRLQGCIRHGDTVARLGGDEFTVLLEDIDDIQRAVDVADRIADALSAPFDLDGYEVFVSTSIGIARRVAPGDGPDDLLRNADVALYDAKNQGKNRHAVFDPAMTSRAWERIALEADLRHALERGQLRVHYQPVVDLVGGRIVEVEALVRWQHPERGLLSPADFIPLAEETGLIVPIGQWVLTEAARQVRAWQLAHPTEPPLMLAVNLSVRQFQQPDLVDDIARILAQEGLPPTSLKLELTESAALRDEAQAVATLQALRALGIHLAFDDFGTGYSAVSYLRRFPVDTLKIDRSFVDGLGVDPDDTAIVRGVVAFAKMLNLRVTAEGVETAEQLGELRTVGCDCGQGYYIARPLPAEDLSALLSEGASW